MRDQAGPEHVIGERARMTKVHPMAGGYHRSPYENCSLQEAISALIHPDHVQPAGRRGQAKLCVVRRED